VTARLLSGLPVLLLVAGAAAAIVLLGRGEDMYRVRAEFKDAGGLRTNSNVRIEGVPVGKVASLEVTDEDSALATLEIDPSAGPVGRGARAHVRAANILGEKYVDLDAGDTRRPAPSGARIPPERTDAPVELDDLLNVLDPDTRSLLSVLINESGIALSGRGADFNRMLAELPPALDQTETLLAEFSADNRALGRLVEKGDRFLASLARERAGLGRFVERAAGAFSTTASRHAELRETVRQAPATVSQLRGSLARLDETGTALGPSAVALRASARPLTAFLRELPPFTTAAVPTLRRADKVAPRLVRLGRRATPVLRRLRPAASELSRFAAIFDPASATLDAMIDDTLAVTEGWARAVQPRDAASHLFRNQNNLNPESVAALVERYIRPSAARGRRESRSGKTRAPRRGGGAAGGRSDRRQGPPELRLPGLLRDLDVLAPDELREAVPDVAERIPDSIWPPRGDAGPELLLDFLLGP
jgi:phospholipid/cholesterol/gamma-HCH transport system substrate-binding protein